jgi:hypothetical protein
MGPYGEITREIDVRMETFNVKVWRLTLIRMVIDCANVIKSIRGNDMGPYGETA